MICEVVKFFQYEFVNLFSIPIAILTYLGHNNPFMVKNIESQNSGAHFRAYVVIFVISPNG